MSKRLYPSFGPVVLPRITFAASVLAAIVPPLAHAESWSGTTGLRVSETYSDNISRESAGRKRSDWSTEVSPWISYSGRGARTSGNLDARLQNWMHSDSQTSNRTGLQLNAAGAVEAYEDHLFVDTSLNNDRQQLSQFSAADSSYGGTGNSTEVTRFSISPNLRWRLGDSTNASVRYRFEKAESDSAIASRQSESATVNLRNGSAFGRLGWGMKASHYDVDSETTEAASTNSYSGSLSYAVTPELSSNVFGGQEFQNFNGGRRQHSWNWGAGLQWQPDERTSIQAQTSKRFFGRGFDYELSHRFRNSAIEWGYSRDLNTQSSTTELGSNSDEKRSRAAIAYAAELAAVSSSITDPAQRNRIALANLAKRGISIFDLVRVDYASNQSVIDRSMRLAWVVNGVRDAVSLAAHKSDRETISQGGIVQFGDDFSTYQRIKDRGWDASWTHDLSAITSLGLLYAYSNVHGTTVTGVPTSSRVGTLGLNLSTQFAPFTTGGMSYSHIRSTGSADYRENAVAVQLNHRF